MASRFETSEYVKGLTVAGMARAQARAATGDASGGAVNDLATLADLERLKDRIDAAAVRAEAELRRFRLLTFAGIVMLCASILLLHFSHK